MPARLILNADDFGLTPGINRAIAELHDAGCLTSTTLMPTGPAFAEAVALARARPTLGVGCHITLTDGIPVSHPEDIPSLLGADGKTFRPSFLDLIQALLRGTVHQDELIREVFAQVQKLQRAGIDVTHLDSHKHTHIFPPVTRALLHVAERCSIGAIRNAFEQPWSLNLPLARRTGRIRRLQVKLLGELRHRFNAQPQLRSGRILTTDATIGISATGNLIPATLAEILHALPPTGTFELVTHPGYNTPDLDRIPTRLRASRNLERQALLTELPRFLASFNSPQEPTGSPKNEGSLENGRRSEQKSGSSEQKSGGSEQKSGGSERKSGGSEQKSGGSERKSGSSERKSGSSEDDGSPNPTSPPELIHFGNLGIPGHQRALGHFTPNTGYEPAL